MNTKTASIILGTLFILISLLTLLPNQIVGTFGFFYTDFGHNMIHLLTGVVLFCIAFERERWLPKTLRVFGIFYLALAVVGALSIGSASAGKVLGLVGMSGADNILHLVLGILMVVLGTKSIRMPEVDTEENI